MKCECVSAPEGPPEDTPLAIYVSADLTLLSEKYTHLQSVTQLDIANDGCFYDSSWKIKVFHINSDRHE